jgi:hypothetical protein
VVPESSPRDPGPNDCASLRCSGNDNRHLMRRSIIWAAAQLYHDMGAAFREQLAAPGIAHWLLGLFPVQKGSGPGSVYAKWEKESLLFGGDTVRTGSVDRRIFNFWR